MSKKQKTIANVAVVGEDWDSGIKTAKFCGRCDKQTFTIKLTPEVHNKIQALNDKLDSLNVEWLGYLLGERRDNECLINDLVVPEQTVSGASVEVVGRYSNEHLIGTIHLHPFANGTFFSATDEDSIGENHDIMIVTTPSGQYKGSALQKLECGARMRVDADVVLELPPNPELDDFLSSAIDKIKVRKFEYKQEYVHDEPKVSYQDRYSRATIRYCGRCRKRLEREATVLSEGVEMCLPCYHNKDKTPTEGGMACGDCKKHTPWGRLVWEQGTPRCSECHATWRAKENENQQQKLLECW